MNIVLARTSGKDIYKGKITLKIGWWWSKQFIKWNHEF